MTGVDFHKAVHSRYFICVTAAYVLVMASQVGGISHLVKLANECGLRERIAAMIRGDKINPTEQSAVLHAAPRSP